MGPEFGPFQQFGTGDVEVSCKRNYGFLLSRTGYSLFTYTSLSGVRYFGTVVKGDDTRGDKNIS